MADQPRRGRGVARGRASARPQESAQAARPGAEAPRPAAPSAWGAPPRPAAPAAPRPPAAPAPATSRGAHTKEADLSQQMSQMTVGEAGRAVKPTRGAHRGGRTLDDNILRTRPQTVNSKKGTTGNPVNLVSNHFRLETQPKWALYQYRVDFSHVEDSTFMRRALLRDHRKVLGGYIFDGTVLYTVARLNPDPMTLTSVRKSDSERIQMTVRLVGDVTAGDYAYIQVFNLIMRKCLSRLDLQLLGRDYFDQQAKVDIPDHKLQIWPGYKTTISQHENDILMVCEIAHKVLRMDTVLDLIRECFNKFGKDGMRRAFGEQIIGKIVLTTYNNKTYRVDDVNWDIKPASKFNMKGVETSYVEYYQTKYNVRIADMHQPLLMSRSKERDIRAGAPELLCLVPELCRQTGLTDDMRANWRLMADMATHTRVNPDKRVAKLLAFNRRLHSVPEVTQELKDWDMRLEKELMRIPGRVLPAEKLVLGNGGSALATGEWTKELRSRPILSAAKISCWVVIVPNRARRDAEEFAQKLITAGNNMKIHLPEPKFMGIQDDRSGSYVEECEKAISQYNPTIIFLVVPNNRIDRYSAIKKKCCVDRGVLTQVVLAKSLGGKNALSVATKVVLQMNCKTGGAAWAADIPMSGVMMVGYDVCHDTQSRERSFGAMVASMDKGLTRYFSAVTPHANGEELSNELSLNIVKALHKYRQLNGALPAKVVVYRDGVGDGQIPFVYNHEVTLIQEKLKGVYGPNKFEMVFIIVSKRINTRFFDSQYRNPQPGTVVDDVITLPERYDFFLVSQQVREGTVSPTSYNVIFDTSSLKPDHIQRLTYKLCHVYFNWSGQVKVPAPCQYAHKLATLAGQALHRQPHSSLETLLYYL